MLTAALVLAGLAAAVHVYIFYLESLAFDTAGRTVFGLGPDDVPVAKPWAYNQGFYNLFLAIGTVAGLGLWGANRDAGVALVVLTTASMLTAALVLVTSDPGKARAAFVQGTFPLLCLVALALSA